MINRLIVNGPFRGISGHDHHSREMVRGLVRQGVQIQLRDLPEWAPEKLPQEKRDPWFETLDTPVDARVVLHFCMPHQATVVEGKRNVNFTMFEATRVPAHWIQANQQHDLVILPTAACRDAWIRSGLAQEKIRLCPFGVDADLFRPDAQPLSLCDEGGKPLSAYRTRILNVSDLTPRKNLHGLLRLWLQVTERSDDAILILKLTCRSPTWLAEFEHAIAAMEESLGKSRADAAPMLFLINQRYAGTEMPGLFAAATYYWSMSHGEGWDLPMMEAAATGLHIMAPDHSAYPTYLDSSVAHLIPAQQVPVNFEMSDGTHEFFQGAEWWDADEAVAASYLRQAIDNPVTQRNDRLRAQIIRDFTWQSSATRLQAILSEVEECSQHQKSFSHC